MIELYQILDSETPSIRFILLGQTTVLDYILQELTALKVIDEIERQPAYKRLGIDLDKNTAISKSETSLKKDNDDLGYKSNNSFLHDNVD